MLCVLYIGNCDCHQAGKFMGVCTYIDQKLRTIYYFQEKTLAKDFKYSEAKLGDGYTTTSWCSVKN